MAASSAAAAARPAPAPPFPRPLRAIAAVDAAAEGDGTGAAFAPRRGLGDGIVSYRLPLGGGDAPAGASPSSSSATPIRVAFQGEAIAYLEKSLRSPSSRTPWRCPVRTSTRRATAP